MCQDAGEKKGKIDQIIDLLRQLVEEQKPVAAKPRAGEDRSALSGTQPIRKWMAGQVRAERWRVGSRVPLNVYEGDRPVCQCHTEEDARTIVAAMRMMEASR